jgi:hypothetical protein
LGAKSGIGAEPARIDNRDLPVQMIYATPKQDAKEGRSEHDHDVLRVGEKRSGTVALDKYRITNQSAAKAAGEG